MSASHLDRLDDALHQQLHNHTGSCPVPLLVDVVKKWVSDALDAEEAAWPGEFVISAQGARAAIAKIRLALTVEPPVEPDEG